MKRQALWALGICFALIAIRDAAVTAHQVSFITDMNIRETVAASALGFTLGISAISKFGSGWLADRLSSRYIAIMYFTFGINPGPFAKSLNYLGIVEANLHSK